MGPCIVTRDEIQDPHELDLWCRVNGEEKQHSNTRHQIFRIGEQLAALSQGRWLEAGDILATGTPSGVGFARTPRSICVWATWWNAEWRRSESSAIG